MISILSFLAGIATLPAMFLAVSLFIRIIDLRDRTKDMYVNKTSTAFSTGDADIRTHPVKVVRIAGGYRVTVYDDTMKNVVGFVELEKVDVPPEV